jgi:acetate kinase
VRAVEQAAEAGDERSQLALDVFAHRVRKYLGAYLVHLGGRVDAVVFSAGTLAPGPWRICLLHGQQHTQQQRH